jgi:hypothetical protein
MTITNSSRLSENAGSENAGGDHYPVAQRTSRPSMQSTETKRSLKTTELIAYIGAVVAVIITALVVGQGSNGGPDPFSALDAIRYITFLTIGYMVARGLAKAGSHERYSDHHDAH